MKLKFLFCLILIALLASTGSAQQSSSTPRDLRGGSLVNWPQFNFEPGLTGYNPFESVLNPSNVGSLTVKWSSTTGNITSQPVIANGILYVGTQSQQVDAYDANTGIFLWNYATEGAVTRTSAVANGIVYVPGIALYALDANTGALIWQVENDGQLPVTVVKNIVYGQDNGGNLVALNAQTGALIWKYNAGSAINSGIAVVNGVAYAATRNGDVWALDGNTGALIWSRHFGVSPTPQPTLYTSFGGLSFANATVYVAAADYKSQYYIYALKASTGATIWKSQSVGQFSDESTPAVANGMVYVAGRSTVYGISAAAGSLVWQMALPNSAGALSPIVANGVVYVESFQVGGFGHDFFAIDALDASTGTDLWEHVSVVFSPLRTPTPAVVNGMVYGPANDENSSIAIGAFGLPDELDSARSSNPGRESDLAPVVFLNGFIVCVSRGSLLVPFGRNDCDCHS